MKSGVDTSGLAVSYDNSQALIDVNLQVPMGHIVAVVGPNGSGKTTLLKALQGRVAKQHGTVRMLGLDPYSRDEKQQILPRIRYVADTYQNLFEYLTVREYQEFVAASLGVTALETQRVVRQNLNTFGLSDIAETRITTLSHGTKKKLHVASGFLLPNSESTIVLLDEPFDGMDPEARAVFYQFLKVFVPVGKCGSRLVMVSSHNLVELESLATFLIVLRHGRVVSAGTLNKYAEAVSPQMQYILRLADPRAEEVSNMLRQSNTRTHVEESYSLTIEVEHADALKHILLMIWDRLPSLRIRELREKTSTLENIYHNIQANV